MQHTLQGKKRKPNQNWLNVFDFNAWNSVASEVLHVDTHYVFQP